MPSNKNVLLEDIGSKEFVPVEAENEIEKLGREFRVKCIELLNQRGVSASGALSDSISPVSYTHLTLPTTSRV